MSIEQTGLVHYIYMLDNSFMDEFALSTLFTLMDSDECDYTVHFYHICDWLVAHNRPPRQVIIV